MLKYDSIFSLGEVCFCANYLQSMHLRKFSAPFDWIAGAGFNERINFILNNFENFFNKEDLVYRGKRVNPEPCNIYYNQRTHIVFNHDFPINEPFDEYFIKVAERYNRRIKRLYKKIDKAKKVLIVYMEKYKTDSAVTDDAELCSIMAEINKKYPKTHIDLMYIRHNEKMKDGEFIKYRINEYVTVAQCFNKARDDDNIALGNYRNVRMLFTDIRCKDNLFNYLYYLVRKIYKNVYRHKIKDGEEYIRLLGIKIYHKKI